MAPGNWLAGSVRILILLQERGADVRRVEVHTLAHAGGRSAVDVEAHAVRMQGDIEPKTTTGSAIWTPAFHCTDFESGESVAG